MKQNIPFNYNDATMCYVMFVDGGFPILVRRCDECFLWFSLAKARKK